MVNIFLIIIIYVCVFLIEKLDYKAQGNSKIRDIIILCSFLLMFVITKG